MKKKQCLIASILMIAVTIILTGCSNNAIKELTEKGYFANSYENAISQTEIAGIITKHFSENGSKKKALLITIDGFRVEGFKYFAEKNTGMMQMAKDGGLYWTKPANIKSKAQVDIGVNFLSVLTGKEPSSFDVLKSTDAKRDTPLSILSTISKTHNVKFLTDNKNYIDIQLSEEFKVNNSQTLNYSEYKDLNSMQNECIKGFNNSDFINLAISTPYFTADANYKMSNAEYLSSLIHLNYYIGNIYNEIKNREGEDWLVVVASTCGGRNKLAGYNEEGNILTFMLTNKKVL